MKVRFIPAMLLLVALPCAAQNTETPDFSGYITRIASTQDFDLNGRRIQVTEATKINMERPGWSSAKKPVKLPLSQLHPYIGEPIDVFGEVTTKEHGLAAMRIILHTRTPHPVSGFGIIDALPPLPATASPTDHLVRADGYLILITASTQSTFDNPLSPSADIATNKWIRFRGIQRTDGIVVAKEAHFSMNVVDPQQDHRRPKTEYDPTAVPADNKQSFLSRAVRGIDPEEIPPSTDAAMQARVGTIGASLIPKYQSSLPASDPTRINFRFQLLKANKDIAQWHNAATLPNGIILIPQAVLDRLQNDSQIAAVLANSIARALEKQRLTDHDIAVRLTIGELATAAGTFLAPEIGIVGSIATSAEGARVIHDEDQSGRVSLWLLHDAGYDVDQAPIAWWLLAQEKPQPLADTPLPRRAASLYQFLGDSWPQEDSSLAPAISSVTASTPPAPSAPQ